MNRKQMLNLLESGMNPLDVSIQKWKDIVFQLNKGFNLYDIEYHTSTCALCEKYYDAECPDCDYKKHYGYKCDDDCEYSAWIWFDDSVAVNDEKEALEAARAMVKELEEIKNTKINT